MTQLALHLWVLILFGPFMVVGPMAAVAAFSWPDYVSRPRARRSSMRFSPGWAVA